MKHPTTNIQQPTSNLLRLAQLLDGARASVRFNVHCYLTQEISKPFPIRELKRRERRAPLLSFIGCSMLVVGCWMFPIF
jgi:hypothetical protein